MNFVMQPWHLFLVIVSGWVDRQQQEVIDYLRTEEPRRFSAALLALGTIGFSLRNVRWKLLDAIRAYRIPPNQEAAAPTRIDWLTKLKLNRLSLAATHTAFSTGC
jgi:hypothetical protein